MSQNGAAPTFELGLVMAGAISAGAYTAGVVDFFIEALDAWQAAKDRGWDGPSHEVKIRVMSGASAGAMTSAIAAIFLNSKTTAVHDSDNPPPPVRNRLFDSWVKEIDITKLLGSADVEALGRVVSLLDSSELESIAKGALQTEKRTEKRAYVDDPLAVFLTVANLRGVPYGFRMYGTRPQDLYGMRNHMDDMRFAISFAGQPLPGALSLDPATCPDANWEKLVTAALASGAFPIGLRPRVLSRPPTDYDSLFDRLPAWDPVPDPYNFLCVDGGLMNNEPLELARRYLSGDADLRNPRPGEEAHRAVIMIDPFPNLISFDPDWEGDERVVNVVKAMFGALVSQARFKPEELELAEKNDVYSRFMISPSRQDAKDNPVEPAMASAILGGFGGFLSEGFRKHDFQLGRRNCQAFLQRHFVLPEGNPLFAGVKGKTNILEQHRVRDRRGEPVLFERRDGQPQTMLPIIPLTDELAKPISLPRPPDPNLVNLDQLEGLVRGRVRRVGRTLIDTDLKPIVGWPARLGAKAALHLSIVPRLTKKIMAIIETELSRLGPLNDQRKPTHVSAASKRQRDDDC
jgi:hypothetical protein